MKKEQIMPKMRSIPHLHNLLSVDALSQFLEGGEYELSEKVDGINMSLSTLNKKDTFIKTKKDNPHSEPEYFLDIYKELGVLTFKTISEYIKALNAADFPAWIIKEFKANHSDIITAVSKIDNSINPLGLQGISIFGELLGASQTNTLVYSDETIGKGANIIFGCVIRSAENSKGFDISIFPIGLKIMKDFVEKFNGINGFKVYFKQIAKTKLNSKILASIQTFIEKNKEILTSRKRDPEILEKKSKAKNTLEQLVRGLKKDALDKMGKTISFLGNTEIEGLVVRNINNGAMTKIVDLDKFTELNKLNWEGDKKLGELRGEFIENLSNTILKSADIFQIKKKQEEKIVDYLMEKKNETGQLKFHSLDELIDVLYKDAAEEVQFESAKKIYKSLSSLVLKYIEKIKILKKEYENKQNKNQQMSEQNFNILMSGLDKEKTTAQDILIKTKESINLSSNPLSSIIKYVLGPKTINQLFDSFVEVKK